MDVGLEHILSKFFDYTKFLSYLAFSVHRNTYFMGKNKQTNKQTKKNPQHISSVLGTGLFSVLLLLR